MMFINTTFGGMGFNSHCQIFNPSLKAKNHRGHRIGIDNYDNTLSWVLPKPS